MSAAEETEKLVERVEMHGAALTHYYEACHEARQWGGPTIYPNHPVSESMAYQMGRDLKQLAALVRAALATAETEKDL